jgi:hypothetical protein
LRDCIFAASPEGLCGPCRGGRSPPAEAPGAGHHPRRDLGSVPVRAAQRRTRLREPLAQACWGHGRVVPGGGAWKGPAVGGEEKDEEIVNESSLTDGGVSAALPKLRLPLPARSGDMAESRRISKSSFA